VKETNRRTAISPTRIVRNKKLVKAYCVSRFADRIVKKLLLEAFDETDLSRGFNIQVAGKRPREVDSEIVKQVLVKTSNSIHRLTPMR
jgi:hypothetical protein